MHLYEYKLQRCFYTIVYIFQNVFCVCCMYSTWHIMDTFIFYFILFCSIIQSMFQELNTKSNLKQTILKKLCIELNM